MRPEKRQKENGNGAAGLTSTRCAIYTRKSTEEGLEQSFNTLDAQRDAGESFINSQHSEGILANGHATACSGLREPERTGPDHPRCRE